MDFYEMMILVEGANIQLLVNDIYERIVRQKTMLPDELQNYMYHFLTGGAQGVGFEHYRSRKLTPDQQKKFQQTYQQIKAKWNFAPWTYQEGSSYEYFFLPNKKSDPTHNFKRYITVAEPKSVEMAKLDVLMKNLLRIPSAQSIKIPVFVGQLLNGVDNIVIYFGDEREKPLIDQAIMQSGIKEADRSGYYRSNFGIDRFNSALGKKESDTELSARFFAQEFRKWINQKQANGATMLASLRTMPEAQSKSQISQILTSIFAQTSPHRTM